MNPAMVQKAINWALIACLLFVCISLYGKPDDMSNQSPSDYGKKGLSAAYNLTQKLGYDASVDSNILIDAPKHSIVVVPYQSSDKQTKRQLETLKRKGLAVILLPFDEKRKESPGVDVVKNTLTDQRFKIDDVQFGAGPKEVIPKDCLTSLLITREKGEPFGYIGADESSIFISLASGRFLENEQIDKLDNAAFFASLLKSYGRDSKVVVFSTAFYNASENSFIASLGPWARGIWVQFWVFAAVLYFAVSTRFGLPTSARAIQRGQRDLIDGLRNIILRRKNPDEMAKAVRERIHQRLAKRHRVSRAQIAENERKYMSDSILGQLHVLQRMNLADIPRAAQKILYELDHP